MAGFLDSLAAGKPSAAPVQSGKQPLAPKVRSAKDALTTQTAKVKANFKAQGLKSGNQGYLNSLATKAEQVAKTGNQNDGFDFSWNPIKLIGEVAQNVPAIGTALNVIDTPRAAVTSAIKELVVDPTTGHGGPSFGDFIGQLGLNNHVGFGDLEEQANPNQNEWIKRLIGLTGDIAADPLTYVGVGAVGDAGRISKGLATADRVELAKSLAAKAEQGVAGATDEAIAAVGRKGVAGLAPELQRALDIRPSLTVGGVPLKASEPAVAALRKVTSKVREVAGDTVLGRGARAIASTPETRGLVNDVVSGGAHAADAAKSLESISQARAAARQFGKVHGKDLTSILRGMSKDELRALPSELESGVLSPASAKVRTWLDNVLTEANKRGANLSRIEDYYPHALTADASEAMAKEGVLKARAPGMSSGPELLRKYKPGEDFMGQTLVTGSSKEINQIAKEKLGYDIFSSKAEEVLPQYLQAVQNAVHRGSYAGRLTEHGVGLKVAAEKVPKDYRGISRDVSGQVTVEPQWLNETRTVEKALPHQQKNAFLQAYDRFTQLWKAAATFSPGFHVRNAYSGVFNNFVAGVHTAVYGEHARLARLAEKGALKAPEDIKAWDFVEKAVEATGNPFDPAEIGRAGTMPTHNKVLTAPARASRSAGNFVENNLRGAMALDSYKAGDNLTETIDRINRFHFNYTDISPTDRWAKRIIPFWMFQSRNLPLQVQMLARRPSAYTKFLALQRNLSLGLAPEDIVPSYFGEQGAIQTDLSLPGGEGTKYLALDLPFLRVNKDLEGLADPIRLLSNANPLIKAPIEAIAGKRLYNNVPFNNQYQDVPWYMDLPVIKQALEGIGVQKEGANGAMATDQMMNTLESLLPLAGRARRLSPSEDQYKERFGTSLASFLGLTSLTNTPSAQTGELARRKRALEEFVKTQQQLGYYPKAKSNAPKSKPFGKSS